MLLVSKNLKNSAFFDEAWALYDYSFPQNEKRTLKEQKCIEKNINYKTLGYFDENKLVAILFYWVFDKYVFIEHFAIDINQRGKSYGSKILKDFLEKNSKVVLEIELLNDEVSKKRLKFYEKLDFVVNEFKHYQVPFREEDESLELLFLSYKEKLSKKEYEDLYSKMNASLRL